MRQTRFRTLTRARLRACLAAVALLTASAGVVVAQAGSASAATTTLHVAANGTGTACSSSQPCSLAQAKTTVRALNDAMTSDITIEVANGTYRLTAPSPSRPRTPAPAATR